MAKVSRLHHIGIPVSDMERSIAFYTRLLGFTEAGITATAQGPELSAVLQVDDAELEAVFLRSGDLFLELLHYSSPEIKPFSGRNCDVGVVHVCFEVDSVQAVHDELVAEGVAFNAPPMTLEEGDLAGHTFAYFRDPDGIQLELFELPKA